jgi:hypothetical protein
MRHHHHRAAFVRRIALAACFIVAACSRQQQPEDTGGDAPRKGASASSVPMPDTPAAAVPAELETHLDPSDPLAADEAADLKEIQRLKARVHTIANLGGCAGSGECRLAPLGTKPCGGPWSYIAYCPRTTDTAALRKTLDEVQRKEHAFNEAYHPISDCMMAVQPQPGHVGGRCVAAAP